MAISQKIQRATHFLVYCCSVTKSCPTLCYPYELQHTRLPCPSSSPALCSNSWKISIESVMLSNRLILTWPLLLLPSIFPSIRVFPMNQLFASGDQSIAASASASVLPKNIQGQFPLGLIGLISLQSKELSRVFFSSTTVWKHQLLGTLPCHMVQLTWLLENHSFD